MKTATVPAIRVAPELRAEAESLLAEGETLSAFVVDALRRGIDYRKTQRAFIAHGRANLEHARRTGEYVPARAVVAKLRRRLTEAQRKPGKK